jgi:hypothetical protein
MNLFNDSKNKYGNHGAALIITLMVITAISGFAFFASRLSIAEIVSMNKLENSMVSFYASEAGIEQGLLMRRYNHEVEFSSTCTVPGCSTANQPTSASGDPYEFILDSTSNSNVIYNLKIWHRNDAGKPETGPLAQDQVIEYDTNGLSGSLALTCIGCNSESDSLEYTTFTSSNIDVKGLITSNTTVPSLTTTLDQKIRLRSWGPTSKQYIITSSNPSDKLDSRTTSINSTGGASTTNRKMEISIDRTSGAALSLSDFVLFGSTSIISSGSTSTPTPSPTPTSTTLTYGPNVTSTSYTISGGTAYSNQVASNAFDHNAESCTGDSCYSSIQSSSATYVYIGQDFGSSPKNIRQIRVYYTGPYSFNSTLQYSDDNTNWNSTNAIIVYPAGSTTWKEYSVDNYGSHRYWRFLDAKDDAYLQIAEVEMKEAQ